VKALEESKVELKLLGEMKQDELTQLIQKDLAVHFARTMYEAMHPTDHLENGQVAAATSLTRNQDRKAEVLAKLNIRKKQTTRSKYRQVLSDLIGPDPCAALESPASPKKEANVEACVSVAHAGAAAPLAPSFGAVVKAAAAGDIEKPSGEAEEKEEEGAEQEDDNDEDERRTWRDDFVPAMREGMAAMGENLADDKWAYRCG
jgi:hypothetical protein